MTSVGTASEVAAGGRIVAVLGTRYADLDIEREVLGEFDVHFAVADGADRDEIVATARDAAVILAGSRPRFDRATLEALRCPAIVRYGIGVDSIDLDAARELGICVARVSDYGTEAVATHAVTLALAGSRRLTRASAHVHAGGWGFADLRPLHLPSVSTAGVVGFGRIGRYASQLFRGFGFAVLAHDPYAAIDADGVRGTNLEELLSRSDVVSLHLPGAADGSPLLGSDELATMKPGSVLVNTARGSLVDPEALVTALAAGRPAVAALDVYATEPPDLSRFAPVADQIIATPHMAWYAEESEQDLRRKAAQEAARILRGGTPIDVVVPQE